MRPSYKTLFPSGSRPASLSVFNNFILIRAVKHGARSLPAERRGGVTEWTSEPVLYSSGSARRAGLNYVKLRAVRQKRHILLRQNARDNALIPWRPAILSPTDIFLFCATYTLTTTFTPGLSSSPFSRVNFFTSTTMPPSPCGTRSDVSWPRAPFRRISRAAASPPPSARSRPSA